MKPKEGAENQVRDYLERAGVRSISSELEVEEHPDKGFMTYIITEDGLWVPDVYGDGQYWLERAKEICREHGLTKILGGTRRNPEPYKRFFGMKVVGYLLEREVD